MSETQNPSQELSPEQLLVQLSDVVTSQLDKLNAPELPEQNGVIHGAVDFTTRSTNQYVEFKKKTPDDGSPILHTISYVMNDDPKNLQVLTWHEGDSEISHGVRFFLIPDDDVQEVNKVVPTPATLDFLTDMMEISGTSAVPMSGEKSQTEPKESRTRRILGKIGLSGRSK